MYYYKLGIEPSSKKWEGYENPSSSLWLNNEEISSIKLFKNPYLIKENKNFEYRNLKDGKIPPINSIGSKFIVFNSLIADIHSLIDDDNGASLITIKNQKVGNEYLLLNPNYNSIDCVDWELSEIDHWPQGAKVEEWQNKRGRFFINPVLIENKIPLKLKAFKLDEWDDAFNIIISEEFKNQIMSLDFDHSFLTFDLLKLV